MTMTMTMGTGVGGRSLGAQLAQSKLMGPMYLIAKNWVV